MFWQRFNKINAQCCYWGYSEVLKINAFLVAIKCRIYIQQAHNYIFDQRCGNHFKCFIIVLCYRVYVYLGKFLFFTCTVAENKVICWQILFPDNSCYWDQKLVGMPLMYSSIRKDLSRYRDQSLVRIIVLGHF